MPDFYASARHDATFPWISHSLWFYEQMIRWRQIEASPATSAAHLAAVRSTYRPDIYRRALAPLRVALPAADTKPERFFDETIFDPAAAPAISQ